MTRPARVPAIRPIAGTGARTSLNRIRTGTRNRIPKMTRFTPRKRSAPLCRMQKQARQRQVTTSRCDRFPFSKREKRRNPAASHFTAARAVLPEGSICAAAKKAITPEEICPAVNPGFVEKPVSCRAEERYLRMPAAASEGSRFRYSL